MSEKELDDLLEKRLAKLEVGERLEACLAGLPKSEAALLMKAARLRAIPTSGLDANKAAAQRRELLQLVKEKKMSTQSPDNPGPARPRRLLPAMLVGAAAFVLICAVLTAAVSGLGWLWQRSQGSEVAQNPSPAATSVPKFGSAGPTEAVAEAPDPQSATLNSTRGVVEVQASDGAWAAAQEGQVVKAGERVRTGALSSVTLAFYDGSRAHLGPYSEASIDALDARTSGPRVVKLTQWIGESDHSVAASSDPASAYEVNTPSGSGTAKGTLFHVLVTSTLLVRFDVDEGSVAVTSLNVTVVVVAGQSTTIVAGEAPSQSVFRIAGEGEVSQVGSTWGIAGRSFLTNSRTVVIGDPQVGDWVAFEGRTLADGTRFLDSILLLRRPPVNRFAFVGTVEAMGEAEWTISGRAIQVDNLTDIQAGVQAGDRVEVRGSIASDGALRAARIRLAEADEAGSSFEFVGVVEAVGDAAWTISGISVAVEAETEIGAGLAAGDLVKVEGRLLADGSRLATSIELADEEREFEFTGRVESLDPWTVSGITFSTDAQTEVDEDIQAGDRVKVEGRVLEDGTWLAGEIERLNEEENLRFKFVGQVSSIDPWIVAGTPLVVDDGTEIEGEIAVGDAVKVKGRILDDGAWLAEKVERLDEVAGCLTLSSAVRTAASGQIVLLNNQTIELDDEIEIEGEIKVATVVVVYGCISQDGQLVVYSITVIYQLDALPVYIIHDGDDDDDDDDDHDDDDDDD